VDIAGLQVSAMTNSVSADLRNMIFGVHNPVWLPGGASGIGLATAHALRDQGAKVAVLDLAGSGPDKFVYRRADVSDDPAVRSAVASAAEELGGLDVLVNNAGAGAKVA
jgi:NAD(P)-dependent dehydrogenase (short-subunit alcohol dehydrogenase family)